MNKLIKCLNTVTLFSSYLAMEVDTFVFFYSFRTCFRGLSNPPARQRLFTLPPPLRHVPVQLCVLSTIPLQHEGEHGNV